MVPIAVRSSRNICKFRNFCFHKVFEVLSRPGLRRDGRGFQLARDPARPCRGLSWKESQKRLGLPLPLNQ